MMIPDYRYTWELPDLEWAKTITTSSTGTMFTWRAIMAEPKKVIFNPPATIILWDDGTKTVVKCSEDDEYSKETGIALCFMKKYLGNHGSYNKVFKRWINGSDN